MTGETKGFAAQLAIKLEQCQLSINQQQQDKLAAYLDLLKKWNAHFNLTAIHESRWVNELLLDALVALPHIKAGPVLDVGSGAGVPAIPLAIALPSVHFTLLDSNGKKTRFIKQVLIDLQIPNVDVIQSRLENYTAPAKFAMITSRAFTALDQFVSMTTHLLIQKGEWLAWKGDHLGAELDKLPSAIEHLQTIPVALPDTASQRCLVRLKQADS